MDSNGIGDSGKFDFMGKGMYPMSQIDRSYYATPTQAPLGAKSPQGDYDPSTNPLTGEPIAHFDEGGSVDDFNVRGMVNPTSAMKYDPRYMPLRIDDRPMNPVQAALLRLQAEKQIGEGQARAGIAGLLGAIPGQHGVSAIPGSYDVGYKAPVGPGNLDISAYRAMRGMPDGKVPQGIRASYSMQFNEGGIARFNGEDGSDIPAWNPESGQVKLQQYEDPKNPFSGIKKLVDYTIPKDSIKTFVANEDGTGGKYILNDGSTMNVGGDGTVQSATPGRDEYTLNKDKYYQPTGAGLNWDSNTSMLTKKIGGVDVQVPGIYTKGGYKDQQGNLLTDANGVPVALAPAQYDSGAGESGLSKAAPYIAAATMMAATGMPTGFEGMVTAPESLLGSMGYLGGANAGVGLNAAKTGSTFGSITAPTTGSTFGGLSASQVPNLAAGLSVPTTGALVGGGGAAAGTSLEKMMLTKMALEGLSGAGGGGGSTGPSSSTSYIPYNPGQSNAQILPAYNPNSANPFGIAGMTPEGYYGYKPTTYSYGINPFRRMASGGIADLAGGQANLGSYSDGGQLLKGPGDGMSDHIPATIGGEQPARLAEGEFVIPADVVSHLGNGSTDAGAKQLYKMMDKIRMARTGSSEQGKQIHPDKFLPKG